MKVKKHKLVGENVSFDKTTKTSGEFKENLPDTIIIHYTAGESTDIAVKVLKNPKIKASAHMVVGLEGEVVQLADLNVVTWHAGKSAFKLPSGYRKSFNRYSIGIEISNPGYLYKNPKGDGYLTWYDKRYQDKGKQVTPIPEDKVFKGKHRNYPNSPRLDTWYKYPDVQLKKVWEICEAIKKEYPIKYILGHEEIAPGRKSDPGPAFPLEKLREDMGVWKVNLSEAQPGTKGWIAKDYVDKINSDDEGDAIVNVEKLNFRDKPDGEKIALPLTKGDILDILSEQDGWLEVILVKNVS